MRLLMCTNRADGGGESGGKCDGDGASPEPMSPGASGGASESGGDEGGAAGEPSESGGDEGGAAGEPLGEPLGEKPGSSA